MDLARGAAVPLASLYSWQDYALSAFVIGALFFWLLFEFLCALRFVQDILARLSGQSPASAQEAAQHVAGGYERRPRIALNQHHHPEHHGHGNGHH